ncbi:hypothetical protein ACOSQ4_020568 [Xanthoceras sorbifolium]
MLLEIKDIGRGSEEMEDLQMEEEVVEIEEEAEDDTITVADQLVKFVEKEFQAQVNQSTAYIATPKTMCDPAWYADSGAINHVTSNFNNLSLGVAYSGSDRLTVGNGQQLPITHIVAAIRCLGSSPYAIC